MTSFPGVRLSVAALSLATMCGACSAETPPALVGDAGQSPVADSKANDELQLEDAPSTSLDVIAETHTELDVGTSTVDASTWAPYFYDSFESYAPGTSLSANKPFDAAGNSVASIDQAAHGKQSAKMAIHPANAGGFGNWGGTFQINPTLPKGSEVWVRLFVYWPKSFVFSAQPWMKFLRLHNQTGAGANGGYNDLYVDHADQTTSVLRTIKESHDVWAVYDGPALRRDTWERYEMYLFIDDHSVDSGGKGRVRIWRDDALIFDRTDVPTVTESKGVIDFFYLFTYWNDETPPDNTCYVDDLAIATSASPPPFKDAKGNAVIGTWVR